MKELVLFLGEAWRGENLLREVFWPGFIVLTALDYTRRLFFPLDDLVFGPFVVGPLANDLFYTGLYAFLAWFWVAAWRCARNTSSPAWTTLARLYVLVTFIVNGLPLLIRVANPW